MSAKTDDMPGSRIANRCRNTLCRIPRLKSPGAPPAGKVKFGNVMDSTKSKPTSHIRSATNKSPGARSIPDRPKSAKSCKSLKSSAGSTGPSRGLPSRSARTDSHYYSAQKPSSLPKRNVITVPMSQAQRRKTGSVYGLPSQEVIRRREERELLRDSLDISKVLKEISDIDNENLPNDILELKSSWENKLSQYENLKQELECRQRTVIELYASLKKTQMKMSAMGEKTQLPSVEDLRVMNVAKVSPDQLLQLCATHSSKVSGSLSLEYPMVDMKTFYEAPTKLVATCEKLLGKRQEVIDWFDKLKEQHVSVDKGLN